MSFTDIKQQHIGGAVQCRFTVYEAVDSLQRVQLSLTESTLTGNMFALSHTHTTKCFTEDILARYVTRAVSKLSPYKILVQLLKTKVSTIIIALEYLTADGSESYRSTTPLGVKSLLN